MSADATGLRYLTVAASGFGAQVADLVDRAQSPSERDPVQLRADAELLRSAVAVMRAHLRAQEHLVARLESAWQGSAADEALASMRRNLDGARSVCASFASLARDLDDYADLIEEALTGRERVLGRVGAPTGIPVGPQAVTTHLVACVRTLTHLFTTIDRILDAAREQIEAAVAQACAARTDAAAPVDAPSPAGPAPTPDPAPIPSPEAPRPVDAVRADPIPAARTDSGATLSGALGSLPAGSTRRFRSDSPAWTKADDDADSGAALAGAGPL